MNTEVTPDNAAPSAIVLDVSATPICLANGAKWGHTGIIGVGEGVERGACLYSAATVTALEAEVRELRAGLERVLSSMSSYDAALADHLRKSITGAGAK